MSACRRASALAVSLLAACTQAPEPAPRNCRAVSVPQRGLIADMVLIPGGDAVIGDVQSEPEERPLRTARLEAFWMDRTEVSVAQFRAFVSATGYVTESERSADASRYPQATAEQLLPSGIVFAGAEGRGNYDLRNWWKLVQGANWRRPYGPGQREALAAEPVTQVTHADASAYAAWLGRELPSEAEWEWAARGGLVGKRYVWGDEERPQGHYQANTWQGLFPVTDLGDDGFRGVAPVGCYAPNAFGLYDMAGNVWEWTSTPAFAETGSHIVKGGSYLCADNFCARARPAARQPGAPDVGSSHTGFRTILRKPVEPQVPTTRDP